MRDASTARSGKASMEFNRNQLFLAGVVVLLLGIQLRYVQTFVLNERTTQFLAQKMKDAELVASNDVGTSLAASAPVVKTREPLSKAAPSVADAVPDPLSVTT